VSTSKRIAIGSDHGGYALKQAFCEYLQAQGVVLLDVGTHSEKSVDYPVFARAVADAVASGRATHGLVIDGAGIGSAMVANKVPGVRAAVVHNVASAVNATEHNNANVLSIGAGFVDAALGIEIIEIFLTHTCTVDRHLRRALMIEQLDVHLGAVGENVMSSSMSQSEKSTVVTAILDAIKADPSLLGGAKTTLCGCAPKSNAPDDVAAVVRSGAHRLSSRSDGEALPTNLASMIDHTLLKANATYDDVDTLCEEAKTCGFKSVCVNPTYVRRCADNLRGSNVLTCTVIGFPLGATSKEIKVMEARRALRDGANELDMVINIGALKSGDIQTVYEEIRLLAETAREGRAILKVIIETALLTDEEKVTACVLAKRARAHFVKTSTGFSTGGATVHDVDLMARAVENKLEVKASGGIRTTSDAESMIAAGATRIGASVGIKISDCNILSSCDSAY
jgi:deoxyribose-phosphate aldolase